MTAESIHVEGGLIQGIGSPYQPGVMTYLGIPYAAPPLGPNRFRPPQPIIPWTGIKLCDTSGPACLQPVPDLRWGPDMLAGHPQSEDCLYLNVFAPDPKSDPEGEDGTNAYQVFVWFHGGGFCQGGAADPTFEGSGLAAKGVIVVVPSFRLGK